MKNEKRSVVTRQNPSILNTTLRLMTAMVGVGQKKDPLAYALE